MMGPGYRTSVKRLYRIGISLLLTAQATGSLANAYASNEPLPEDIMESRGHQSADREAAFPLAPRVVPNPLGNQLVALGNDALDEIRGGFELPDTNLKFSFGIERAVFINGELVANTVLNVKDLQWVAGGAAPQVLPGSAIGVIQNGAGNNIPAQIDANIVGTVIQNTLNDQSIRTVTTVNAVINSAQVMRTMSVQAAVQNGIVSSLRR